MDEPLNPIAPSKPEAVIGANVIDAASVEAPVIGEPPAADLGAKPASEKHVEPAAPVAPTPASAKPINPEDKRVVNGLTDINQLAPFKYPWAWEYFLNANKNHWTPLDINITQDVHD